MWSFVLLRIWPLIDWMESEKRFSVLLTLLIRTLSDFRVSSAGREKTHSNNSFPFFIMKREKKSFRTIFRRAVLHFFPVISTKKSLFFSSDGFLAAIGNVFIPLLCLLFEGFGLVRNESDIKIFIGFSVYRINRL